ncbi:hypothetical protein L596_013514 [Steinernema carpocapsae]|uniref:Uncharacterized protein n=1 Tax=Steinernema carpocapsae TaxID=34508 RepID=A0A4U5P0F9_STECR|nr:hypothetical protein L596_013514 [Steinernema carpocapsae]
MTRRQSSRCSTRCSKTTIAIGVNEDPDAKKKYTCKQMAAYCIKHSDIQREKETARNHRNPSLRNRRKKKYWSNNAPLKASEDTALTSGVAPCSHNNTCIPALRITAAPALWPTIPARRCASVPRPARSVSLDVAALLAIAPATAASASSRN